MKIFKNLKTFLINNLSNIFLKKWVYIKKKGSYKKEIELKIGQNIIPSKTKLEPLRFKTKYKIKKGWYLFGIRHQGDNQKCFGNIRVGLTGFSQSRPMYPTRFRWRVIRVNYKNHIYLELSRVKNIIKINNIFLIPLINIDAWRRILKRIRSINKNSFLKKNYFLNSWKTYNNLLLSQKRYKNLVDYNLWIEKVEIPLINSFLNKKQKKINFIKMIDINFISQVEEDDWIIPFKSNYVFSKDTLNILNDVIKLNPSCSLIYSDEDQINKNGIRSDPHFKPSWNRELFWNDPNYSNIWIIKGCEWNAAIKKLIIYKSKLSLFSIILEITYQLNKIKSEKKILHLPIILLHKLKHKENHFFKNNLEEKSIQLFKHLNRHKDIYGSCKKVSLLENNIGLMIEWENQKSNFLSIFIPTKDNAEILRKCIESIFKYNPGIDYEIIIINNNSKDKKTYDYFKELLLHKFIKVIDIETKEFNYSYLNNQAALKAKGNIFLLLNNDTEFLSPGWGARLSSLAARKDVGCVGVKLIYSDWTIQHAGIILGIGGVAGHSHKFYNFDSTGYANRISLSQEISANTAACLAISKINWFKLNGLDEKNLKVNYNDLDLCLRAQKIGLKNIYIPDIMAIHHESKTRGKPEGNDYLKWKKEYNFIKKKWRSILNNDPNYSQYLSLEEEDWSLSMRKQKINPR